MNTIVENRITGVAYIQNPRPRTHVHSFPHNRTPTMEAAASTPLMRSAGSAARLASFVKRILQQANFMSITVGIIFLWFGALKFLPNFSPAEAMATEAIHVLTFGLIPDSVSIIMLAVFETALGFCLIFNLYRRTACTVGLMHMCCTFSVLFLFPDLIFTDAPFGLTLAGQYILKNLIIVGVFLHLRNK